MYKVTGINVAKVDMHIAPTKPVNKSSFGIAAARIPTKNKNLAVFQRKDINSRIVLISIIKAN